jgi:hypothetical protein
MSIAAVSGLSVSDLPPLDQASAVAPATAVTPVSTATRSSAATQGPGAPAKPAEVGQPAQPFLLIPTVPLTPQVLAELVGRQL